MEDFLTVKYQLSNADVDDGSGDIIEEEEELRALKSTTAATTHQPDQVMYPQKLLDTAGKNLSSDKAKSATDVSQSTSIVIQHSIDNFDSTTKAAPTTQHEDVGHITKPVFNLTSATVQRANISTPAVPIMPVMNLTSTSVTTKSTETPKVEPVTKFNASTAETTMIITTTGRIVAEHQPQTKNSGAIVAGSIIGGVLLIGLIVGGILLLIRRRKQFKKGNMKRPGNPAYSSKPAEDEFIFHREVAEAKPMLGDPRMPDIYQPSKKRAAPRVPSFQEERKKRPAPAPPTAFASPADMSNLYEKDSHGSFENIRLSSYTVLNNTVDNGGQSELTSTGSPPSAAGSNGNAAALRLAPPGSPDFSTFGRKRGQKAVKSMAAANESSSPPLLGENNGTKSPNSGS